MQLHPFAKFVALIGYVKSILRALSLKEAREAAFW